MGRGAKRPLPHPLIELVPKCVDPTCGAIAWGYSFTKAKHLSQIINGLAPSKKERRMIYSNTCQVTAPAIGLYIHEIPPIPGQHADVRMMIAEAHYVRRVSDTHATFVLSREPQPVL